MGNSNEEKARELLLKLKSFYFTEGRWKETTHLIIEALSSAEKKGMEHSNYCSGWTQGWNEAIEAAVKVAEDFSERCACGGCTQAIADKLKGLKK